MYERKERHELNCNWDIMSISYNVNYYYSVLSLSTQTCASGTSLPACVGWRRARRERAAWWRWALNPCRQANPTVTSQGTGQGEVLANDTPMVVLLQSVWHPLALVPRCGIPWLCLISRACIYSVFIYWSYCELQSLNPERAAKAQQNYSTPGYENNCSHVLNTVTVSLSAILRKKQRETSPVI